MMLTFKHILCATCVIATAVSPAAAQNFTVGGSAHALSIDLTTTPVLGASASLDVGPLAASNGMGPGAFSDSASVANANASLRLSTVGPVRTELGLGAGLLTSSVVGTDAGATATAGVLDLGLSLDAITRILFIEQTTTLVGIGTGELRSTASVDAATGVFMGSTTVAGLSAVTTLGALGIDLGLLVTPAANSVLLDLLGLRVTFNEQITTGDTFTTNALSLRFDNFASGLNLVNGSIIIGQSQVTRLAVPAAVPEPATWAMMIAGFGLVGSMMRSRRRSLVLA